jgi:hypothetical protein
MRVVCASLRVDRVVYLSPTLRALSFSARDEQHNQAVVITDVLPELLKAPAV